MDSALKTWTDAPAIGLSPSVAEERATTAPISGVQGTAASCAALSADRVTALPGVALLVAHAAGFSPAGGARSTDLPAPVPRGAPV